MGLPLVQTLFALTIALFGVLVIPLARLGAVPAYLPLPALLLSCFGAACLLLVVEKRSFSSPVTAPISLDLRWIRPAYLALAPCAIAVLISIRSQISWHGTTHLGYIHQILAGTLPPEDSTLPGKVGDFIYWPYHALLAALVQLTELPAPFLATLLNLAALTSTLLWMQFLLQCLHGSRIDLRGTGLVVLFALFAGNLLGCVNTLYRFASRYGLWNAILNIAEISSHRQLVPLPLVGDERLWNLAQKFFSFNGGPPTFPLYLGCLAAIVLQLKHGFSVRLSGLLTVFAAGSISLYTPMGMFILTTIVPAATVACVRRLNLKAGARHIVALRATRTSHLLLGGLIALLGSVAGLYLAEQFLQGDYGISLSLIDERDVESIIGFYYALLPLAVMGYLKGRRVSSDNVVVFLASCAFFGLLLVCLLSLPEYNEYKFVLWSSVPVALVATFLFPSEARPRCRLLQRFVYLMVVANLLLLGAGFLRTPWFRAQDFAYEGRHVVFTHVPSACPDALPNSGAKASSYWSTGYLDLFFGDAYTWIRDHTPADAVAVVPLFHRDDSALTLLAERLPYAASGALWSEGALLYRRRSQLLEDLFHGVPTASASALLEIREDLPGRPKYLVAPRGFSATRTFESEAMRPLYEGLCADVLALGR